MNRINRDFLISDLNLKHDQRGVVVFGIYTNEKAYLAEMTNGKDICAIPL